MKRSLALTVVLFICVLVAGTAYARKTKRAHQFRPKTAVARFVLNADTISPYNLLYFAQSLIGTPYRDASSDPSRGFDCSGFVTYVFKSFNAAVPRSSEEYANAGREVRIEDARPGDVIIFKGTKSYHPHSIGHVGIVYSNENNELRFIHSTSGKEYGVTISGMDDNYKRRFVKVVRLLSQNDAFQNQGLFQAQAK